MDIGVRNMYRLIKRWAQTPYIEKLYRKDN